jgi:hypothetical protein
MRICCHAMHHLNNGLAISFHAEATRTAKSFFHIFYVSEKATIRCLPLEVMMFDVANFLYQ